MKFPEELTSYFSAQDRCHRSGLYEYLEDEFGYLRLGAIAGLLQAYAYSCVLDIGCGGGLIGSFLKVDCYCGLDVSEYAIERCVRRFGNDDRRMFLVCDPLHQPDHVPQRDFDVVIWAGASFGCLRDPTSSGWKAVGRNIESICRRSRASLVIETIKEYGDILDWLSICPSNCHRYEIFDSSKKLHGSRVLFHIH